MVAAAILKVHFNGHKSVGIAGIHIKFGSETKADVPETENLQISLPPKSKMAAGRHLKNTSVVITRLPVEISYYACVSKAANVMYKKTASNLFNVV